MDGGKRNKAASEKNVKVDVRVTAPDTTTVKAKTTGDLKQNAVTRIKTAREKIKKAREQTPKTEPPKEENAVARMKAAKAKQRAAAAEGGGEKEAA
jgi:hypothetical protein